MITSYVKSSIGKKQIVGISGILMVAFVLVHLTGNFLIFKGPEALNDYSAFLHSLGGLLWVARIGLIATFLLHFGFTYLLVVQNKKARSDKYQGPPINKGRSWATRLMPYTGSILLIYLGVHLLDFTFTKPSDLNGIVRGDFLGLYGLVYNSFLNPLRVLFYIAAMFSLGFHLTHGVQSFVQTIGFTSRNTMAMWQRVGLGLGIIVFVGFSSIPLYVLMDHFFLN